MSFRLTRRHDSNERQYGPHGYPPTLHIEPLIPSGTMGVDWGIVDPLPTTPKNRLTAYEKRAMELMANGFVCIGSRVVPKRPIIREERGNMSVVQELPYKTAAAAILAWRARQYQRELIEMYGADNVETCRDTSRIADDGYEPDEYVAYFVRADSTPGESAADQ